MSASCNYGGGNCGSTPTTPVVTVPSTTPKPISNDLPFTGGDVVGLTLIGTLLIAAGVALVHQPSRKRRIADAIEYQNGGTK